MSVTSSVVTIRFQKLLLFSLAISLSHFFLALSGMGMEVFATLAGAAIQGQIVGVYHAKRAHDCNMLNQSEVLGLSGYNSTSALTDTLHNTVSCSHCLHSSAQ